MRKNPPDMAWRVFQSDQETLRTYRALQLLPDCGQPRSRPTNTQLEMVMTNQDPLELPVLHTPPPAGRNCSHPPNHVQHRCHHAGD